MTKPGLISQRAGTEPVGEKRPDIIPGPAFGEAVNATAGCRAVTGAAACGEPLHGSQETGHEGESDQGGKDHLWNMVNVPIGDFPRRDGFPPSDLESAMMQRKSCKGRCGGAIRDCLAKGNLGSWIVETALSSLVGGQGWS